LFALLGVLLAARVPSAAAQESFARAQPGAGLSSVVAGPAAADSTSDIEITTKTLTVSGAPRSYQVVSVPVPDALAKSSDVSVEIMPHGRLHDPRFRSRSFDPLKGQSRLGVTIGIPANAIAGRLVAATCGSPLRARLC